jgi:hypothetical protein
MTVTIFTSFALVKMYRNILLFVKAIKRLATPQFLRFLLKDGEGSSPQPPSLTCYLGNSALGLWITSYLKRLLAFCCYGISLLSSDFPCFSKKELHLQKNLDIYLTLLYM